jgi:hypothetical protein
MIVTGVGTAAVLGLTRGGDPSAPAGGSTAEQTRSDAPVQPPLRTSAPRRYHTPTADDFELTVRILSKRCFGSAGCNIDFRNEVAYTAFDELNPATTYELTYEVLGSEDPHINTMTLRGDRYTTDETEFIGTDTADDELTAVVIDVLER